jgi:hypothetical protein
LDSKSRVNRVYKAVVKVLLVWIKVKVMVRARVKVKVRVRIKAILYKLKDFIGVHIGKVIRRYYRYLNNSNLNLLITLFLTRKLYTSLDVTRDTTIQLGLLTLEQCNEL